VNENYLHHAKAVYPAVSIRTVAEQIHTLYEDSVAPLETDSRADILRKTDDLTDDKIITSLNDEFATSEAYQEHLARLKQLAEQRKEAQKKLQKYRALQAELQFLKDPANSVQPHLATKDGPLAQELTKSRALATKLAGRVTGLKRPNTSDSEDARPSKALLMSERERIESALMNTDD
jgi:cell fate (sporulation/competence/biofilm development) regulator YlbF (YheA/YmcA/DUF963 family)